MALGAIQTDDPADMPTPAPVGIAGAAPPTTQGAPSALPAPGSTGLPRTSQMLGTAAPPAGGIEQGTGKGQITTSPPDPPEYNAKKLAKAQTPLDLLNAMKPASRTDYMDWWQKQHGDIDAHYDHLKSQLGARPSDDEPSTKKEKLAALLEFGLHLMKNSAGASTNQGAVLSGTLSDETDAMNKAHAAKVQGAQSDYDTQAQAIETQRAADQKGIGTAESAMKGQATQDKDRASELKDTASAYKDLTSANSKTASAGPATYAVGPGGVIHAIVRDADGKAHAEPVTGIDGKPFAGRVLGREAGSGIDKGGQSTAAMRNHQYLIKVLGLDDEAAAKIAFKTPSGHADQDHNQIFRSALAATMGDEEKAKRVADQYVLDNYGAKALGPQAHPAGLIPHNPPPQALSGLKPGMVRDFGANGKWTVGIDGSPHRVSDGPQTIQ